MANDKNEGLQSHYNLTHLQKKQYANDISSLKLIAERSKLLLEIEQNSFNRLVLRINKAKLTKGDPNVPKAPVENDSLKDSENDKSSEKDK